MLNLVVHKIRTSGYCSTCKKFARVLSYSWNINILCALMCLVYSSIFLVFKDHIKKYLLFLLESEGIMVFQSEQYVISVQQPNASSHNLIIRNLVWQLSWLLMVASSEGNFCMQVETNRMRLKLYGQMSGATDTTFQLYVSGFHGAFTNSTSFSFVAQHILIFPGDATALCFVRILFPLYKDPCVASQNGNEQILRCHSCAFLKSASPILLAEHLCVTSRFLT